MSEAIREYRYRVDREGRVFHEATELVDPPLLRYFLLAMTRAEDGRCLVLCQGERNWFDVGDPALAGRDKPPVRPRRVVFARARDRRAWPARADRVL